MLPLEDGKMWGAHATTLEYLNQFQDVLKLLDLTQAERLSGDIFSAYEKGHFVFICGNGGSGANSSHFCEDLGKSSLNSKDFANENVKRLKVLSLTDNTPYILAWGNDEGFDRIFVEQLKNLASPSDMLIAISGSGNSPNVLAAVDWANGHHMTSWGVTGFNGGELAKRAHANLHVPCDDMGVVESVHLLLFHWILDDVHGRINHVGRHADSSARKNGRNRRAA